ncbi:hypothetical protein [Mesobacillus jeotgali]|uniref:hypothetical protein n=1 Tax=Mesobacillus jeotgali TaxID=129985 RepID=UPI000C84F61A|nr:hypothetical protein [Mesobacillus jeotgali]
MSEEGATSDRFGCGRRKAVRSESNFRQVWVWKERSCQKKGRLRTGSSVKGEKLSEEGATSDRFGCGRRTAVRRRGQLRTDLDVKGEKLSEEGATSDRFECERRKTVRRRGNFGQV